MKYRLSFFTRASDNLPVERDLTWAEVCKLAEKPEIRASKGGGLFSGAIFRTDPETGKKRRAKANAVEICVFAGDVDHCMTWAQGIEKVQEIGCQALLYTTHSHRREVEGNPKGEDRFRIVIPSTFTQARSGGQSEG